MKLPYKKAKCHPLWAAMKPENETPARYHLAEDGIEADFTPDSRLPYANHIEMTGRFASSILSYRISENRELSVYRFVVFPTVRVIPNDTRGSLPHAFAGVSWQLGGAREQVTRVRFDGLLTVYSEAGDHTIERTFCVAPRKKALIEKITIHCKKTCRLVWNDARNDKTIGRVFLAEEDSVTLRTRTYLDAMPLKKDGGFELTAGEHTLVCVYSAEEVSCEEAVGALRERRDFLRGTRNRLRIKTPDARINQEIAFAKIRASESIFETKNGLMHSPGGGQYYAALWTNDQCEYANPLFAYLGDETAKKQSLNCYRLYSALAKEDEAIYTSIIAQGDGYWHGAGDRGDSSMYVYGFTRFLLASGDRENAETFLPSLETACAYVMSRMNGENVIESDSDELENRFESGKANLSTAVISYDAFLSMSYLEAELGRRDKAEEYETFADRIRSGIKTYFEADVEGFATYRYCREESRLRSWICLPLTVGINDRAAGTIQALKSDKLKKPCGLLTRNGNKTFWDRSLLYALRGIFYCGDADDALAMLKEYTETRLLGEHAPYPIEAYPEGNGAQLSAESALYVRIFTEGVLGLRPVGFSSFTLKPSLPEEWESFSVENMAVAGKNLSVFLEKSGEEVRITIPELGYDALAKKNEPILISC